MAVTAVLLGVTACGSEDGASASAVQTPAAKHSALSGSAGKTAKSTLAALAALPRGYVADARNAPGPFTAAVVVGRGFRYGLEALFAYYYGEPALRYVNEHIARISIWLAVVVAVAGGATMVWRRMRKK